MWAFGRTQQDSPIKNIKKTLLHLKRENESQRRGVDWKLVVAHFLLYINTDGRQIGIKYKEVGKEQLLSVILHMPLCHYSVTRKLLRSTRSTCK